MFVPGLTKNLLSVSRVADVGYNIKFIANGCNLFRKETNELITCSKEGNLYKLGITTKLLKNNSSTDNTSNFITITKHESTK